MTYPNFDPLPDRERKDEEELQAREPLDETGMPDSGTETLAGEPDFPVVEPTAEMRGTETVFASQDVPGSEQPAEEWRPEGTPAADETLAGDLIASDPPAGERAASVPGAGSSSGQSAGSSVPPSHTYPPYGTQEMLSPADERTWAMLSHLSVLVNLVTGFLGPVAALVIYLVFKDRSRYVAYHAMQSFVFQMIWWVGGGALIGLLWTVVGVLSVAIVGLLCIPIACVVTLAPLVALVYGVIGAIQTSQGQDFKYWLVGDWVRSTLTGV
jgi:uncharacterized Tic20 family protein